MPMPEEVKSCVLLNKIWTAVHDHKMNQIIVIEGLPRTGKSFLSLYLASALDKLFSVEKNVAFTQLDFQQLNKKNAYIGACNIWEEAGVADGIGANSRDFWTEGNKRLSGIFQTMGFARQISIVNLPNKMMLDKHLRSLCHWILETQSVDYNTGLIVFKAMEVENSFKDGIKKYPRYLKDDTVYKAVKFLAPCPPLAIVEEYDIRQTIFKNWLKDKFEEDSIFDINKGHLQQDRTAANFERFDAIVAKIEVDPSDYIKETGAGKNKRIVLDTMAIAAMERISNNDAYLVRRRFEKKHGLEVRLN